MTETFDEDFYLKKYPDVGAAVRRGRFRSGKDHYERYGRNEGRCPNEKSVQEPKESPRKVPKKKEPKKKEPKKGPCQFDENFYLEDNPDVRAAVQRGRFGSGKDHYERHGRGEGRRCIPYKEEEILPQLLKDIKKGKWPKAVPDWMLCDINSEEDKTIRAEGILDLMFHNEKLGKFLDFGCGEGHVAVSAKKRGAELAVGYDIDKPPLNSGESILTDSLEEVKKLAPFDTILLFDVLDHVRNPVQVLDEVKVMLKPNGYALFQCHPWLSRHGSHLYRDLNIAFLHLAFSEEELKDHLSLSPPFSQKITDLSVYEEWITKADLKVTDKLLDEEPLEGYFKKSLLKQRLSEYKHADLECCFLAFRVEVV